MRKIVTAIAAVLLTFRVYAQDTLKTTTLQEVVVTGTKSAVPVEKSGKSITKLTTADLSRNAGKTLPDILNDVAGLQMDGNFSTPGSNISYYLRGGRNRQTLILIDGVPLNDPSAINAEYDLRYIPLSQIESIEVLRGGLSTLYGTGAAAGVINIKLKDPAKEKLKASIDVNAASFDTYAQSGSFSTRTGKTGIMLSANNITSEGFSAAEDRNDAGNFDNDGFSRQNGLLKVDHEFSEAFQLQFQGAYEQFDADYDAFEFTDANNRQEYNQFRAGITPTFKYAQGEVTARLFYNNNRRQFISNFPSDFNGRNFQGELLNRHQFTKTLQSIVGLNYQRLAYEEEKTAGLDSTHFSLIDPYASLLLDLPSGLTIHAGLRLNTHSVYGSKLVYNFNPSFLFNQDGQWKCKLFGSISTSYITPSLYQLYSIYGNRELNPEEATNYDAGLEIFSGSSLNFHLSVFRRNESDPIDFVSMVDGQGNFIGQYRNMTTERIVRGYEVATGIKLTQHLQADVHYSFVNTDRPTSFYRIPRYKYGANLTYQPKELLTFNLRYTHIGDRTAYDFFELKEITLRHFDLVDVYASYGIMKNKINIYGAVNNLLDEKFVAVFGYTTRGRNYSIGIRYNL